MRFGFVLPFGDARFASECARQGEAAGWDGFFVAEWVWGIDAWVSLSAAAMVTERIRLGTMLTPLPRMRPWRVAAQAATLDNLSGGRVILSVGLGAPDTGYEEFGEVTDRATRAELLDEGLDVVTGLWRGQPFAYEGAHYRIRELSFHVPPPPVQQPRIPIWVVGAWPRPRSMRRALRFDGLLPNALDERGRQRLYTPHDIREISDFVRQHRPNGGPFDSVVDGATPGEDPGAAVAMVEPWGEAGATWWLEVTWELAAERVTPEWLRERIGQGPPPMSGRGGSGT
jgi:alkanesulfonate monooxygenase SsuD/methylene tetrahydromethanopterin reductase-like flavin-dependent oxidoreductase (luciferase family)